MNGEHPVPAIPQDLLQTCYAEASQAYPEECCGLLIGPRDLPACDEVRPCRNEQNLLHAEDPINFPRDASTAYFLPARDLLYLGRSLSSPRPVKIIYHSHVDVGAYFSAEDRRVALSEDGELNHPVDYLVIDCGPTGARGSRLFRFRAGEFVAVAEYPGPASVPA